MAALLSMQENLRDMTKGIKPVLTDRGRIQPGA